MPIYDETVSSAPASQVSPSAANELFWITYQCEGGQSPNRQPLFHPADQRTAKLARRTQEFWEEGDEGFPEVIVIAARRGLLAGESLKEFLADLPRSALRTDDLTLALETPATRAMIIGRLERLAADTGLRRRYLALLRDLWESVRPDWEANGLPAVRQAVEMAERRLAAGEHPADLAPKLSEQSLALLRRTGRAEILVCPGYFTGRSLWELPGTLLLGIPADTAGELAVLRARADTIAPRLKALSDPTRLTILLRLVRGAATITDITREFGISQPAVSMHFRVLREAELVVGDRNGSRTMYRVDARRAADLIDELAGSLTPDIQAAS
jgi:DNA-binding transcriptional ArsR family regulator